MFEEGGVEPGRSRSEPREVGMADYEYRCLRCNHDFTITESMVIHGEKKPACPKCKSKVVEQVIGAVYAKTSKKS